MPTGLAPHMQDTHFPQLASLNVLHVQASHWAVPSAQEVVRYFAISQQMSPKKPLPP
jgi:hypothetical protein